MNKKIIFTLCLLATPHIALSSVKSDAVEILRRLNSTLKAMHQLTTCYNSAYHKNRTFEEKQRCLVILARLEQSGRRRGHEQLRNQRPLVVSRIPCVRFNRLNC